jgi:hypothetical protein
MTSDIGSETIGTLFAKDKVEIPISNSRLRIEALSKAGEQGAPAEKKLAALKELVLMAQVADRLAGSPEKIGPILADNASALNILAQQRTGAELMTMATVPCRDIARIFHDGIVDPNISLTERLAIMRVGAHFVSQNRTEGERPVWVNTMQSGDIENAIGQLLDISTPITLVKDNIFKL